MNLRLRRKGAFTEEFMNSTVFTAAKQYANSRIDTATGTPHLLVVTNYRTWHLVMNNKPQIRFVKAHSQRRCRNQHFNFICQQRLLQIFPGSIRIFRAFTSHAAVVSKCTDTIFP